MLHKNLKIVKFLLRRFLVFWGVVFIAFVIASIAAIHEVMLHVRTGYVKTMERDSSIKILSIDHKIPKAKGGSNKLENLLLSCDKCNQRKGKKDYDDFLKWLKDRPESQRRGI